MRFSVSFMLTSPLVGCKLKLWSFSQAVTLFLYGSSKRLSPHSMLIKGSEGFWAITYLYMQRQIYTSESVHVLPRFYHKPKAKERKEEDNSSFSQKVCFWMKQGVRLVCKQSNAAMCKEEPNIRTLPVASLQRILCQWHGPHLSP
jgi:hypothetical protein